MLPDDEIIPEVELAAQRSELVEPVSRVWKEYWAASAQICVPVVLVIGLPNSWQVTDGAV